MSVSDKKYNKISEYVYWTDPKHKNYSPAMIEGAVHDFGGSDFEILKVKNNTSNGMQAMAVTPVNKADKVDMSKVVIAYARTNSDDNKDIQTKILIKQHLLKNTKIFCLLATYNIVL
ncbi:hypothetical protein ACFFIF_10750 [Vagococcus entomophilus]|uniref:Uncharacterized protein n=1 Tax=Vagococcus entomophilus TaxID=1160095 RepID=A0A430AEY9_9ENTE|nr:hypothetical protein [Vagococcus entomophilus]RSU06169.1 hypothetical protein CBF30_10655 [Vagococcus entomophilus]